MSATRPTRIARLLFGLAAMVAFMGTAGAQTPIGLDGDLGEWTALDRLDPAPGQSLPGYELYGRYEGTSFFLAVRTDGLVIGPSTTIWLNTDQDASTGYQIFGFAGGAEYNVNFFTDGQPYLYTGAAAQNFVTGPLGHAYGAGGAVVELEIPAAEIDSPSEIGLLCDFNDVVFLPTDYSTGFQYVVSTESLPPRTDFGKRVGIVYSAATASLFFDDKAYAQLFQAMQHQAMMAGIPFDLLNETDLTDIENLVNYDALVFPYMAFVPAALVESTQQTLFDAVYRYGIGIVTAGDFMTNDETGAALPGDPYERTKLLLGLQRVAGTGPVDFSVLANDISHPVMQDYAVDELILSYEGGFFGSYAAVPGQTAVVLADQDVAGTPYNAVLATETGARHVHFGSVQLLGDANLGWSAIRWAVYGDATPVGLRLGRTKNVFVSRTDMDQSMFADVAVSVETDLYDVISGWKQDYGFVGSYYINIGNDPGQGAYTDWNISAPLYQAYIALGAEIGTHSYTHPFTIDLLSPAELEFEFNQSAIEIGTELGTPVLGAAVPGNPESLATDAVLDAWHEYVSGTYSNAGSGFPGAFGYLTPDFQMIYFNLNMLPDFTLISWLGLTPEQAELRWQEEYAALNSHATVPIVHWMWHDYGPTLVEPGYNEEMYRNTIAMAGADGAEFVTAADAHRRIEAIAAAGLLVEEAGATVSAEVTSTDAGRLILAVDTPQLIQSVDGWYAYGDRSVFLPQSGGEFTIHLGAAQDARTRIVSLPMRADLLSLAGDGTELSFSFAGEGSVTVALDPDLPPDTNYVVDGADGAMFVGESVEIDLDTIGVHDVVVRLNHSPVADAGPNLVVECSAPGEALVTLDGSASSDADSDPLTYTWNGPFGEITETDPVAEVTLPFGEHLISLTVSDGDGGSDGDTLTVTFPVVVEICNDSLDNDCDATTPDLFDADGDSSQCDADCDDADPSRFPGNPEICDGVDNDCDLVEDNGAGPPPLILDVSHTSPAGIEWGGLAGADSYDVVRGDLGLLLSGQGDYAASSMVCLESGTTTTTVSDTDPLPVGVDGFFYLVRPFGCGQAGSYDAGGAQQWPRDPGVTACP